VQSSSPISQFSAFQPNISTSYKKFSTQFANFSSLFEDSSTSRSIVSAYSCDGAVMKSEDIEYFAKYSIYFPKYSMFPRVSPPSRLLSRRPVSVRFAACIWRLRLGAPRRGLGRHPGTPPPRAARSDSPSGKRAAYCREAGPAHDRKGRRARKAVACRSSADPCGRSQPGGHRQRSGLPCTLWDERAQRSGGGRAEEVKRRISATADEAGL